VAADASRIELTREQVLDSIGIECAISTSGVGGGLIALENARHAVAIM